MKRSVIRVTWPARKIASSDLCRTSERVHAEPHPLHLPPANRFFLRTSRMDTQSRKRCISQKYVFRTDPCTCYTLDCSQGSEEAAFFSACRTSTFRLKVSISASSLLARESVPFLKLFGLTCFFFPEKSVTTYSPLTLVRNP